MQSSRRTDGLTEEHCPQNRVQAFTTSFVLLIALPLDLHQFHLCYLRSVGTVLRSSVGWIALWSTASFQAPPRLIHTAVNLRTRGGVG